MHFLNINVPLWWLQTLSLSQCAKLLKYQSIRLYSNYSVTYLKRMVAKSKTMVANQWTSNLIPVKDDHICPILLGLNCLRMLNLQFLSSNLCAICCTWDDRMYIDSAGGRWMNTLLQLRPFHTQAIDLTIMHEAIY